MATIEAQSLQLFAVNSTASEENSTQGPQLSRTTIRATWRRRWGKHYGAQHILSRGCKQASEATVLQTCNFDNHHNDISLSSVITKHGSWVSLPYIVPIISFDSVTKRKLILSQNIHSCKVFRSHSRTSNEYWRSSRHIL